MAAVSLISQSQKYGAAIAGQATNFAQLSTPANTTFNITGGVLQNVIPGYLSMKVYDDTGRQAPGAILSEGFLGKAVATQLISSINLTNPSLSVSSRYSVRIVGFLQAPATASYVFRITAQDGVRLSIDGAKLVDRWATAASPVANTATMSMFANNWYAITIEHAAAQTSERLLLEYSTDGTTFKTMAHASDLSNFVFSYDLQESPGTRAGSLRIDGPSVFNDRLSVSSANSQCLQMGSAAFSGTFAGLSAILANNYAVSFWICAASTSTTQTILSWGGNRHIQFNNFGQIVLSPANGVTASSVALMSGTRYFIVINCNSSSVYSVYVNGTLDGNYTGSYSASTLPAPGSNLLTVGGTSVATPATLLSSSSLLGDLAIWTNTLATSDVTRIYNSGRRHRLTDTVNAATLISNLYAYYTFDLDNGSTQFVDYSVTAGRTMAHGITVATVPHMIINADSLSVSSTYVHSMASVGVGTPNPAAKLHVVGTVATLLSVQSTGSGTSQNAVVAIRSGVSSNTAGGSSALILDQPGVGAWSLGQDANDSRKFKVCASGTFAQLPAITVATTGSVGLNVVNPAFTLDVGGNVNFSGTLNQGGVPYIGSQWTTVGTNLYYTAGSVGIKTATPAFTLDVGGDINFSGGLYQGGSQYISSQWTTAGTNLYFSAGNVGIKTNNPAYALDVVGTVNSSAGFRMLTGTVLTGSLSQLSNDPGFVGSTTGTNLALIGTLSANVHTGILYTAATVSSTFLSATSATITTAAHNTMTSTSVLSTYLSAYSITGTSLQIIGTSTSTISVNPFSLLGGNNQVSSYNISLTFANDALNVMSQLIFSSTAALGGQVIVTAQRPTAGVENVYYAKYDVVWVGTTLLPSSR